MEILTRDFGTIPVTEEDIIVFIQPIFGFEEYQKYVLLCDNEIGSRFGWLQSIDNPDLCFILADPDLVDPSYKSQIPHGAFSVIGDGAYECWAVTVIPENFSQATANLKSPILINTQDRRAAQVILEQDYPIRCPLMKEETKTEEGEKQSC